MRKSIKGISAILMTSILAVSASAVAAPVFAADETYTLTVDSADVSKRTYEVYQIFSGSLQDNVLTELAWGNGITAAGKTALGDAGTYAGSITEGNAPTVAAELAAYLQRQLRCFVFRGQAGCYGIVKSIAEYAAEVGVPDARYTVRREAGDLYPLAGGVGELGIHQCVHHRVLCLHKGAQQRKPFAVLHRKAVGLFGIAGGYQLAYGEEGVFCVVLKPAYLLVLLSGILDIAALVMLLYGGYLKAPFQLLLTAAGGCQAVNKHVQHRNKQHHRTAVKGGIASRQGVDIHSVVEHHSHHQRYDDHCDDCAAADVVKTLSAPHLRDDAEDIKAQYLHRSHDIEG